MGNLETIQGNLGNKGWGTHSLTFTYSHTTDNAEMLVSLQHVLRLGEKTGVPRETPKVHREHVSSMHTKQKQELSPQPRGVGQMC